MGISCCVQLLWCQRPASTFCYSYVSFKRRRLWLRTQRGRLPRTRPVRLFTSDALQHHHPRYGIRHTIERSHRFYQAAWWSSGNLGFTPRVALEYAGCDRYKPLATQFLLLSQTEIWYFYNIHFVQKESPKATRTGLLRWTPPPCFYGRESLQNRYIRRKNSLDIAGPLSWSAQLRLDCVRFITCPGREDFKAWISTSTE